MHDPFVKVAHTGQLPLGKMLRVDIEGHGILLANVDGHYYAVDALCTHEDASLYTGCLQGEFVKCPLHGSRFHLKTGKVMEDPAEEDLQTYRVRLEGEDILVDPTR